MSTFYTLAEVAQHLRCSKAHLSHILHGKVPDVPPPPVFHIGRRTLIRQEAFMAWIAELENRRSEARSVEGLRALRQRNMR